MASKHAIWKFPIPSPDCAIDMPDGSYVVGFGHQDGQLVLWAEVDPSACVSARKFRVVGTGHEFDAGLDYHGLVQMPNGLVWHLLEDAPSFEDFLPPAVSGLLTGRSLRRPRSKASEAPCTASTLEGRSCER